MPPCWSPGAVTLITARSNSRAQTWPQRWYMPILFMALMALGVFLVMGLMLFYAAYAEGHQRKDELKALHSDEHDKAASLRA